MVQKEGAPFCQPCASRINGRAWWPMKRCNPGGVTELADPEDVRDAERLLWGRHPRRMTEQQALELARGAVANERGWEPDQGRLNLLERAMRGRWVREHRLALIRRAARLR